MSKEDLEKEIAKGNVSPIAFYNPDGSNMLYTQKYVEEKDKEIERLNNIINEFEQWIKDSKMKIFMEKGTINKIFFADELLDKLKELKNK